MKALDLFCGAGGASMGLANAGFEVTGVDIFDQPNYPFTFYKANALEFDLSGFDFIWASPPCQAFTLAQRIQKNQHPDLIEPIRQRLIETNKPYCIENVVGAPLINPILLCGSMFPGLRVYRHRLFESNFKIVPPPSPRTQSSHYKDGKAAKGRRVHACGWQLLRR